MRDGLITIAILLFAGLLLSINLHKPFIGQHDWNSVVYSQQARNYLRYGYRQLRFAPVDNAGLVTDPAEFRYSTHYPPLLPILISFSFRIFGIHEWSARMVPILFSLGLVYLIIKIGELLVSKPVGWWAGLFTSVTPLFIYYGKIPVHESVVPFAATLTFYLYFRWEKNKSSWLFLALIGSLVFAELLGWPGYYPAAIIVIYHCFQKRSNLGRLDLFQVFWLVAISAVMFLMFLGYSAPLRGEHQPGLMEIFWLRTGFKSQPGAWSFTWSQSLVQEIRFGMILMTEILLFSSLVWIGWTIWRRLKKRPMENELRLGLLGCFGILHLVLFRNLAWYHEYMLIYSLPFIVLSASWIWWIIVKPRWYFFLPIFLLVAFKRAGYAKALLVSEYDRQVYEEAVRINRRTSIDEIIRPEVEIGNAGFLFNFYADRKRQ